jgi:glycerol kinase
MILVIDVGTTGLRAAAVDETLDIVDVEYRPNPPSSPAPGLVEFDADHMIDVAIEAATSVLERCGAVEAVGVTTQRASTVLWDRESGRAVAPGLGWQDLRTVVECLTINAERDITIAPNQTATKAAWLLANTPDLDGRALALGTIDSWLVWKLSGGVAHISDSTCSSSTMTGLRIVDGSAWNIELCAALGIPVESLPEVVPTIGAHAIASALPGAPPVTAIVGDQQASLIGQACVRPGDAKVTFGTGGILDLCTDASAPTSGHRGAHGTYPLPLWNVAGATTWGVEAIMLSAGSNVEWLEHDLGVIDHAAQSHDVASRCETSDGVMFVPALLGLGTPHWDYGARGTLLGATRGTGRPQLVRAVLEGVAHRGVDLIEAAYADTDVMVDRVRLDGGMSRNPTFVQALADLLGRAVDVSPHAESTTVGAAFLAGLGIGRWRHIDDVHDLYRPLATVAPRTAADRDRQRARWADAVSRSTRWLPELSGLDF